MFTALEEYWMLVIVFFFYSSPLLSLASSTSLNTLRVSEDLLHNKGVNQAQWPPSVKIQKVIEIT